MSEKDTTIWKEYVDGLSRQLAVAGDQAKTYGHPTLTGSAREGALREFFARILPDNIGITGGKVFDRNGVKSAEMDVIVYDKHFPLLRIGEDCLVPVDAAIALFEVKSQLDAAAVKDSLIKCRSIADLKKRYLRLSRIGEIDIPQSKLSVAEMDKVCPAFYVYGFAGFATSVEPLRAVIAECIGLPGSRRAWLPRVLATPTCLGIRKRDDIVLSSGAGSGDVLFTATVTPAGTNVLVADLLERIARRTTYLTQDLLCWSMADYFDPNWYLHHYVVPTTSDWRNIEVSSTPSGW